MARYKGNLEQAVAGVTVLDRLEDGDTVLISEAMYPPQTVRRHRDCEDTEMDQRIHREGDQNRDYIGHRIPDDLTKYKLIIHCGGCMLNEREMKYRLSCAADQGVPMTNYGILIAYVKGILKRSVEVFPEISRLL